MPELPEVEVVRRGLAHWTDGRRVTGVRVLHPRAVRRNPTGPGGLVAGLVGRRLADVHRRGKFLWWTLEGEAPGALVAHLGMSGQFRVDAEPGEHTRVLLDLGGRRLLFDDQRTFGGMWLDDIDGGGPSGLVHVAADPFSAGFDRRAVVATIRARRAGIKSLILDQRIVSGIGNIYADEALWRARVHWRHPGADLSARAVGRVLDHAAAVMYEAIDAGGTSFDRLYVNVNGSSGYFQRDLAAYGRQGSPCPRCGSPIVREPFANRAAYRCPRCQRPPRVLA
jgi:formamidopyrimidine-DNA glycosylase